MGVRPAFWRDGESGFAGGDLTGAIGDSVTVVPIVVAVAALSDLSLSATLLWFGGFQIAWGLHYGVPLSVEPMKALAALVLAGALTTGEFLVAGLLAGAVLLGLGATGSLGRLQAVVGEPVVRGVQFAVALLLLERGLVLGLANPSLAGLAVVVVGVVALVGSRNLGALAVLAVGGAVAATNAGGPALATPSFDGLAHVSAAAVTAAAVEASVAQLAMTVGNAAVATSLLVEDLFDREVSPDELATSMGVTTLLAVPFGGMPMCHGSGGLAGKYAFGARTAGANVALGVGYVAVGLAGVGLLVAFPLAMLGVLLVVVAAQLGHTALDTGRPAFVVGVGLFGALVDLGAAFVLGVVVYLLVRRRDER